MAIKSYKKVPDSPSVALLLPTGEIVSETGDLIQWGSYPKDLRTYASFDTIRKLILKGEGEALCWNGEEIRWRHRRFEAEWNSRPSDVVVIKLPFPESTERSLQALRKWRDWLKRNGACLIGTTGSAASSLLRASLSRPLYLGSGTPPAFKQTLGGRQEVGQAGPGRFDGRIEQIDLPAAYAYELGRTSYGGRWVKATEFSPLRIKQPEWFAAYERPCFVTATLRIPEMQFGPLPKRPKQYHSHLRTMVLGIQYPTGCQLYGTWTYEEFLIAQLAGCRVQKIHEIYAHFSNEQKPFQKWWSLVEEGRAMQGLAGQLAKMTGNALWGRFCMDVTNARRSVTSHTVGAKHLNTRDVPIQGRSFPDHALAETISGRVRAKLYALILRYPEKVITVHTDGAWIFRLNQNPEGWRRKMEACRIDVLTPQNLRYYPRRHPDDPVAVWSGVPAERAAKTFQDAWEVAGYA